MAAVRGRDAWFTLEFTLIIFLLLTGPALQCGPGRGSGRRRVPPKMTPLVFKQHVPNVSENTLGASGLSEGRIARDDERFKDLVVNYNPDIVFKDEEGTGADRIMTQRCKDKLNTLAISVMNQWPGVKLRVTEAWDEDSHHAKDSLHYEGRAVDITTSDRDRGKYGMLARLAVDAGFDWVYYESRGHIHCSVKSDSSIAIKTGGCFPGNSLVRSEERGTIPMSELREGDHVLSVNHDGQLEYSEMFLFMDRDPVKRTLFYAIETESAKTIELTPSHLVYVTDTKMSERKKTLRPVFASRVQVGQYLYVADEHGRNYQSSRITKITPRVEVGVYAPLTKHGTIVVDNTLASCYAVIDNEKLAHLVFAPVRLYHSVRNLLSNGFPNDDKVSHLAHAQRQPVGLHWYADVLYRIAPWFVRSQLHGDH